MRPVRFALTALCLMVFLLPSVVSAGTHQININASGANGTGVTLPTDDCTDGEPATTASSFDYSSISPSGPFSSLGMHLEVRREGTGSAAAWLHGDESLVVLENDRGSLTLALSSGSCGGGTLASDGTTVSGSGTWAVEDGSDSFRQATGSGSFNLTANVGPGVDNTFQISLLGSVGVLDPNLSTEVVSATWDRGLEGGFRHATVTYQVTNDGPGDAFSVSLLDAETTTEGVESVGPVPQELEDVAAGEAVLVEVRYRFDRRQPCKEIDRGCVLDVTLTVDAQDALDGAPATFSTEHHVRVPTTPRP